VDRLRRLLGSALFGLAPVAAAACDRLPDPAFASLGEALTLRIVRLTPVRADVTSFELELTNRGAVRAIGCFGPGRSVTVGGSGTSTWVNHPHCQRAFELAPGAGLIWSETHDVTVPPHLT
jgi:hypothetical protein